MDRHKQGNLKIWSGRMQYVKKSNIALLERIVTRNGYVMGNSESEKPEKGVFGKKYTLGICTIFSNTPMIMYASAITLKATAHMATHLLPPVSDPQNSYRDSSRLSNPIKWQKIFALLSPKPKIASNGTHLMATEVTVKNDSEAEDDSFVLFRDNTTFHGVRDLLISHTLPMQLVWATLIFLALVSAIQGAYMIFSEYIAHPVVVSYFIQEAGRRLALPDIVICPFNRYNRSYLEELNVSRGLAQYLELSYPSPMLHSFQIRQYTETVANIDRFDFELETLLKKLGNISFTQFIKMEGDGFGYGARFVIKLPNHLYNPGVNQMLNDGIAVKLAERSRGIDHDLTFIPSGVHAIMPLSATKYEFMNDPPRYMCEEDADPTYSRVWCFEVCLTQASEDTCNCSLAAATVLRKPSICTTKQFFHCFATQLFSANNTNIVEQCKAQCKPPCSYWQFQKTVSYAHFPAKHTRFFVENDTEWESLQSTIILEVYYTSLDFTVIKHMVAMTPSSFIAQIGGQISLWIGGSIISILQLFIYLFRGLYASFRNKSLKARTKILKTRNAYVEGNSQPPSHSHHFISSNL
ncbi:Acid-sensing ion channel 1 [Toxocara canis]|uniref:Acid-sensing ion channel 1 n=1 Tax=Toxocara canis TaxID=6265 RepID=A0A0B2VZ21_TOXCA|nr:Acid-sensing ion channel 1 [Toxocara canis]